MLLKVRSIDEKSKKEVEAWEREWWEKLIRGEEKVGMRIPRVEEEQKEGGREGKWAGGPLCLYSPQLSSANLTAASLSDFSQLNFMAKTSLLRIRLKSTMLVFIAKRSLLAGVFPSPLLLFSLCASVDADCDSVMLAVFLGLCVSGAADSGKE